MRMKANCVVDELLMHVRTLNHIEICILREKRNIIFGDSEEVISAMGYNSHPRNFIFSIDQPSIDKRSNEIKNWEGWK